MMTTTRILSAVSAAALLGISSVALAQGTGTGGTGGGAGSSGAPAGNTMQRQQDAPPAGSTSPSGRSGSMTQGSSGSMSDDQKGNRAQQERTGKDTQRSTQQDRMGKDTQKSTQQDRMGKDTQKSTQRDQMGKDQKQQMGQDKESAKSGSTVGAASSGSINLSTEQRTTIRQEVLTTSAPRVENVNFSVSVGTVVPSSVRVVEVPAAIVKIRPAWKGYRYFVYQDDIIIVEPRTLKIVAVLEV